MEMLTERPSLRRGYGTVTFLGRETRRSYAENERGVKVRHIQKRAYRHVHEGCPAMTTPPPANGEESGESPSFMRGGAVQALKLESDLDTAAADSREGENYVRMECR
jgi:hypothetical protein